MTKEECIGLLKRYAEYDGMGIPNLAGCKEAMRMAAELLEIPSLPSNLDEAAEEYKQGEIDTYADYYDDTGEPLCFMEALKDAFKAGAEWMAEQGESRESLVCSYGDSGKLCVCNGVIVSSDKFNLGDKVVVQIRKK